MALGQCIHAWACILVFDCHTQCLQIPTLIALLGRLQIDQCSSAKRLACLTSCIGNVRCPPAEITAQKGFVLQGG